MVRKLVATTTATNTRSSRREEIPRLPRRKTGSKRPSQN